MPAAPNHRPPPLYRALPPRVTLLVLAVVAGLLALLVVAGI